MSENAERLLMPRLRFLEFEAVIPARPLSNVAEIVTEKVRVDDLHSEQYVSTENLLADFGGMTATGNLPSVSSVTRFRPKDILVSNIRPYLKKVWQSDRNGGASNDVLVVRAKAHVNAEYLAAILRSDIFIDYIMRGAKGVKMPRGEISMIREFPIPCPLDAEQQKIADCLSSLDDLITLEAQKLGALKTHKNGLMQQLFPAEGETVPRLRFPEFREAGEWEEKKLSGIIQLISGLHLSPEQYGKEGVCPYFSGPSDFTNSIQEVSKWSREAANIAEESDTLVTVKGSGVGEIWYLTLPLVAIGRQLMAVRIINGSSRFIFQFLLTKRNRFEDLASGNLIPGLSRGDILDIEARFPSQHEQQKIADCLSSLDELIILEAQKLNALKTHKKGLMQQLFPTLNEVSA
jgi:type I restriction enzyme S subunit